MAYTPDPYDDTQPLGNSVAASTAAAEFRAVKTKLIEHRDSITAHAASLSSLDSRLDAYDTGGLYKNRQVLAGSGNFTVPVGVTSLQITLQGGDRGRLHATSASGTASRQFTLGVVGMSPQLVQKTVTVAPADVIAYSVGAGSVLVAEEQPSVAQGWKWKETTAATDSTFGATTARRGILHAEETHGAGGTVTSYSADSYYQKDFPIQQQNTDSVSTTIEQGAAGFIIVEW